MTRRNPPSTITLLLPSPSSSSTSLIASSSTLPKSTNKIILPPVPDLEVLILAKKIALEKGQKFDLEAYLNDDQLEEYRTKYLKLPPKPPIIIPPTPPLINQQLQSEEVTPGPSTPTIEIEINTPINGNPSTPNNVETINNNNTPIKKIIKIPDLSHLHWKQRAKRIAELTKEAEMIANGELPESSSSLFNQIDEVNTINQSGGKKGELTDKDKEVIRGSASYWNSLLISARKSRGPQWDYSLQQFQYDRSSSEYYNHGKDPRPADQQSSIKPTPQSTKAELDGEGDEQEMDAENEIDGGSPKKKRKLSLVEKDKPNGLSMNKVDDKGEHENENENGKRIKSNSISQTPGTIPHSLPKQSPHQNHQPTPSANRNDLPSTTPQSNSINLPPQSRISSQVQPSGQTPTPHIQPSQLFGGIGMGRPSLPQNSSSSSSSSIPQSNQNQSNSALLGHGQGGQNVNPNFLASLQQFQQQQQANLQQQQQTQSSSSNQNSQTSIPSTLGGFGGLNPSQLSGLTGLNQQQLNGLNSNQLMGLSNMIQSMNPQFLQQQQQQQQMLINGGGGGNINGLGQQFNNVQQGMSQHGINQNLGMNNVNMTMFQNLNNSGTGSVNGSGNGPMLGGTTPGNNWSEFTNS
ncbi:uncharacterized protein I206_103441 [Kwoniella pini CBS 10737]|uniref:Uncharacterized protein n=1 Tax=Kwoniella pini CBS 10737 TaxID=1296096 RepID=A0A1B9I9V2_9TREE|nr:uncharacterized protein I206_01556 [Kwoniella pini CBS 10737]OCF52270.1 hypothetical protein I206_01556 [Kwoniella pini CBS 10737]